MTMKHQDRIDHFQRKLDHELDSADLYAAIEAGERIVVVDTRTRDAYATEHIPAAINLPHREMNEGSVADLDRDVLYVTYCDGIGCNASTKGALKLTSMGFDVKELVGGLDWWKRDGYATGGREGHAGLQFQCAC